MASPPPSAACHRRAKPAFCADAFDAFESFDYVVVPSRTADIERTLLLGAHDRRLPHIVLIHGKEK